MHFWFFEFQKPKNPTMGCGGSKATSAAGTDPESAPAGAGIRRSQNLGAEKENGGADHDCVNASVCANDRDAPCAQTTMPDSVAWWLPAAAESARCLARWFHMHHAT